jgi:hypothetical protein
MKGIMRAGRVVSVAFLVFVALGSAIDREIHGSGVQANHPSMESMAVASGGRFLDPISLRRNWASADLVMDRACKPFDEVRYRVLAEPASVTRATLTRPELAGLEPTIADVWRDHNFRIYGITGDDGPPTGPMLVFCSDGTTFDIVDSRLISDPLLLDTVSENHQLDARMLRLRELSRGLRLDVARDLAIFALLLALGMSIVPPALGMLRPAVALLLGMSAWGLLGLLLVGTATMTLIAFLLLALRLAGRSRGPLPRIEWSRSDAGPFLAFGAIVVGVVLRVRAGGWHLLHTDSMAFLLGGWAFAADAMSPGLLRPKRGIVLQALHGPGFILGSEGLQSLAPVVAVSGLWVLLAVVARRCHDEPLALMSTCLIGVMVLLSPTVIKASALINSHLLVGGLLLALVVLWKDGVDDQDGDRLREASFAAAVLASAVVLLRAEGVIVIGLLLLGTLWAGRVWQQWVWVWRVAGLTSLVWGGLLVNGARRLGIPVGTDQITAIIFGIMLLALPTVLRRIPAATRRGLPRIALALLWSSTVALLILRGDRVSFFTAARENVLAAHGGWGLLGISVLMLTMVGLTRAFASGRTAELGPALTLVLGFAPLTMFVKMADNVRTLDLDRLLSGGGRVGYFDSVNRMWFHVLFVALFIFLAQPFAGPISGERTPSRPRRRWVDLARAVGVGIIAVGIAGLWNPNYVNAVEATDGQTAETLAAVVVTGDDVVGELVAGAKVKQDIFIDTRVVFPDGRSAREICVGVQFVTFARVNSGSVDVELAIDGQQETFAVQAADLEDWGITSFCLGVAEDTDLAVPLAVTISGRDSLRGESVSVLRSDRDPVVSEGLVFPAAVFTDPTRSLPAGLQGPVVMEVRIRSADATDGGARPMLRRVIEQTFPLSLPMLLAALVLLLLTLDAASAAQRGRPMNSAPHREPPPALLSIGWALVLAAALILTVGINDAASQRVLSPVGPQLDVLPGERTAIVLTPGLTVQQVIPQGFLPARSWFSRDSRAQLERVCLEVPVQHHESYGSIGELTVSLALERRLLPESIAGPRVFTAQVPLDALNDGNAVGCFATNVRSIHRSAGVSVAVSLASEDPGANVQVRTGSRRVGEPAAAVVGLEPESDSVSALRYRWVRQAPSVRERAFGRVGHATLFLGIGSLVMPTILERRRRRPKDCSA